MRFIALAAVLALVGSAAHAVPTPVDFATISMTTAGEPRTVSDTLCVSDGRDLVCDRGAQLLPNGVISATNISATRISGDGSLLTNLPSAAASPTNVPAFSAALSGANQIVTSAQWVKIQFDNEQFDALNNYDNSTNYQFKPNIAGRYIVNITATCDGQNCYVGIAKNESIVISRLRGQRVARV